MAVDLHEEDFSFDFFRNFKSLKFLNLKKSDFSTLPFCSCHRKRHLLRNFTVVFSCVYIYFCVCLFYFLRFYLFIHDRQRQREADPGRGRSRFPAGSPTRDSIPKAEAQPLSHPGVQSVFIFDGEGREYGGMKSFDRKRLMKVSQ